MLKGNTTNLNIRKIVHNTKGVHFCDTKEKYLQNKLQQLIDAKELVSSFRVDVLEEILNQSEQLYKK